MEKVKFSLFGRYDFLLIAVAVAAVIGLFLIFQSEPTGTYAEVLNGNDRIVLLRLDTDRVYSTRGNTVVIKDGFVSMGSADCPDKVCVKHTAISKAGESIVCLPNRLIVRILGDNAGDGLDAVT